MNKVYFITLGCSKNDVDTDLMNTILDDKKSEATNNVDDADVIIVNTCGFIKSAKEESIDMTLEVASYKENKKLKSLILAGCLAERYSNELMKEIPEIDGIIGTGHLNKINEVIDLSLEGKKPVFIGDINSEYLEGNLKSKQDINITEYVKISEGCDNFCTYCIIPKLKGKNRSRKLENIVDEVKYLVENGTREVILIAQNTTDYGIDLYGEYSLAKLLHELEEIEDLKWIRVMYIYPDHFTKELVDEFKNNKKLVKYADIPLQHVSDNVLKRMNRRTNKEDIKNLIKTLRSEIDGMVIRTTFIVGFPGETDEDFKELLEFINFAKLDRVGAFTYSKEEGTPAANLEGQISEDIKQDRFERLMMEQMGISEELLNSKVGKVLEVLIEEKADDKSYIGRSEYDAPEIDTEVIFTSDRELEIGSFVKVCIEDSQEYELLGVYNEHSK